VREALEAALRRPIDGVIAGAADGQAISAGGSIGLALYPRDGAEVHAVIAAADRDMYARKAARRGQPQPEKDR
jgi:GGDEF domain-containing protein